MGTGLQDKSISLSHAKKTNKILGKRLEELENQLMAVHKKDKLPILNASSFDSNSSSNTTTASNRGDVTTPDDLDDDEEDDGAVPDDEREPTDEEEEELPPELDRLVKEAINELKIRDLDQPNGQTTTTHLLEGSADK